MKSSKEPLDEFLKKLAIFVKEHRLKKGWSRYMLSKVSGCSCITIKQIEENQDKDYRVMTIKKIIDALGEPLSNLL